MDEIKQIVSRQEESHFRVSGIRPCYPRVKRRKEEGFHQASLLTREGAITGTVQSVEIRGTVYRVNH